MSEELKKYRFSLRIQTRTIPFDFYECEIVDVGHMDKLARLESKDLQEHITSTEKYIEILQAKLEAAEKERDDLKSLIDTLQVTRQDTVDRMAADNTRLREALEKETAGLRVALGVAIKWIDHILAAHKKTIDMVCEVYPKIQRPPVLTRPDIADLEALTKP